MLAKVFHLDRGIVGNPRKVLMQRLDNAHGVRRSIPEIGVSESNVGSARLYLLADIGEYDVRLNHAKAAIVHVHNRTVAAAMFRSEIGVSESNVGSARLYLLADIGEYDVRLNHAKAAIVHVHNRTVAAAMF